jgi:DeoR/GlpR family transcriptional regulator of sugar metabolism
MTKEGRQQRILEELRLKERVQYHELSIMLNISEDTIRRDINELADAEIITRVKGGAQQKALLPVTYLERELYANTEKRVIAKKTSPVFKDGQVVVFDGGTTPFLVLNYLPRNIRLTLITHSYPIANLSFEFPNIDLIFAGGKASKKSKISTGFDVLKKYEALHADISVIGIHSLHHKFGITDPILEEAEVKTRICQMADRLIAVPTAEKLNTVSTVQICKTVDIDILVTNLMPHDPLLQPYLNLNIQIL